MNKSECDAARIEYVGSNSEETLSTILSISPEQAPETSAGAYVSFHNSQNSLGDVTERNAKLHTHSGSVLNILCCIPARYHSSRLNGKPLLKINGKTIIEHTYRQACKMNVCDVVVLTDDERIYNEVLSFGGNCAIIKEECLNGTERICLYLKTIDHSKFDLILNIQGDEPFIEHDICNRLIETHRLITDTNVMCSTIAYKTLNKEEINSCSRGKVVVNQHNHIMYCSRNVIPASKSGQPVDNYMYNIHVGVFLFNKTYLMHEYMHENTPLQLSEDIEWLKIIEQGYHINLIFGNKMERGIDTPEDFKYLSAKYGNSFD